MQKDSFDFVDDQEERSSQGSNPLVWNVLTVLVLLLAAIVGVVFLIVFVNPQSSFNPFPPPTLPARAALFTATPTAINPLPPTWTPTSTTAPTSTPPPVPTDTPAPTQAQPTSPVPEPSEEESADGMPFVLANGGTQYIPNLYHPDAGCDWLGLAGQVFDMSGAPLKQQLVEVGGRLGGEDISMITLTGLATNYGEAGYEFVLSDRPIESLRALWVQLVDQAGLPLSEKYYFDTYEDCDRNLILINFRQVR